MKYILTLLVLCYFSLPGHAQLISNGMTTVIESGATLTLEKSVLNQNAGTLSNSGTLIVEGDLENTGTINAASANAKIVFSGTSPSLFTPGSSNLYALENRKTGADLFLNGDLRILGTVELTEAIDSRIALEEADLTLAPPATVLGAGTDAYLSTNGAGYLIKEMSSLNSSFTFPVGNGGGQTPLFADVSGSFPANAQLKVKVNPTAAADLPDGTSDFISRHWELVAENITGYQNDVTATYLAGEANGQEASIQGASYENGTWMNLNAGRTNQTLTGTLLAPTALFTGFNSAVLPLELAYFEVEKVKSDEALLNWSTTSERNTSHFQIERSTDSRRWETLGLVNAAGESTLPLLYHFTDEAIPAAIRRAGNALYRLAMYDLDGTLTYSPIRSISFTPTDGELAGYPTPTAADLFIATEEAISSVIIYDNSGRQVLSNTTTEVNLSSLPPGTYHVKVVTAYATRLRTFIKSAE